MNPRRFWNVFWLDFRENLTRPLFIILVVLLVLTTWGLATGGVQISSGDTSTGGQKAWISSEFAIANIVSILTLMFYGFFVAVGAGLTISRDDEFKIREVISATGLTTWEYVLGKFTAAFASFFLVSTIHILAIMFFQYVIPYEGKKDILGPFALSHYLKPALYFMLPTLLMIMGVAFAVGTMTRRAVLVFLFPTALLLISIFFLWDSPPAWMPGWLNKALMAIDPAGVRWLSETYLQVDRGVGFYNRQPIGVDTLFVASRVGHILLGLAAVAVAGLHYGRTLKGSYRVTNVNLADIPAASPVRLFEALPPPLASLGMAQQTTSFLDQALTIAKFEFRGLVVSPGLYLFMPLILLQTIVRAIFQRTTLGLTNMITPGVGAVSTMNTLTLCVCLLLLFYTVESIARERAANLNLIFNSTPVRTGATLFGKALANTFIAGLVMLATWLAVVITILYQGVVGIEFYPFLLVWGGLVVPTFLFWSAFVMLVFAIVNNKYVTYALCLAALIASGIAQLRGKMNWVFNWNLWSTMSWTDLGTLEPNFGAAVLNRILYLFMTAFFIVLTVRIYARREFDATRIVQRLNPGSVFKTALRVSPFFLMACIPAVILAVKISKGFQGSNAREMEKDYWSKNVATWLDSQPLSIKSVDMDVSLEPSEHSFKVEGTYELENIDPETVRNFAITLGTHMKDPVWKLEGEEYKPEDRSRLYVFTPKEPMKTGSVVKVGFKYSGVLPEGITRNGGGMMEFIEPSGVVITSFGTSFAPVVGYDAGTGIEGDKNGYDPKEYPDDYYKEQVSAGFGSRSKFPIRMRVDAPAEYTINSIGILKEDKIEAGRRHVLWESDFPVGFFNIIAGKYAVKEGEGTKVFYNPKHTYNIDELLMGLNGARKYYSEWFYPYPWQTLKLSEFANLAGYAQGFATNITFSESIGFLTLAGDNGRGAFTVAAHESAHQWWGNLLWPGDGPGGNILSEGMANFSTAMLNEQIYGLQARIVFCEDMEAQYANDRQVDSERPMVKITGAKAGDTSVTYNKGGFVFWMLQNHMGRENNLKGLRHFIEHYHTSSDHPLLEDFVNDMREFAPDKDAYDAFTKQWFFEVVVPQYKLEDVKKTQSGTKWIITGKLSNVGKSTMPVQVAATSIKDKADRFEKQTTAEAAKGPAAEKKDYREARTTLTIGPAGEKAEGDDKGAIEPTSVDFRIEADFEPKSVVVDPDALVLQLRRKDAVFVF